MSSLTFLNKPEPLLPQVVSVLTSQWEGRLLDLSGTAVVLPTQEARRRLHEGLVRVAASRSSALLPPVWMLPMQLPEYGSRDIAPGPVEQLCWISVLRGRTQKELGGLFAHRPMPEMDTIHSLELGNRISSLRGELAQAGISLEDAVQRLACENGGFADPRWSTLLHFESLYLKELKKTGLHDRILLQLTGIASPLSSGSPVTTITRVIIAGIPDLPQAYETIIPKLEARGVAVDLLVCDPNGRGTSWFDECGRPSARWAAAEIETQGGHSRTHLYASESEMAEAAVVLANSSGGTFLTTAVGVTSPDVADLIRETFHSADLSAFNPAGTPLDSMALGRLLGLVLAHLQEDDFRSALQLLRNRDIQVAISMEPEQLARLDQLQSGMIPSSLDDLMDRWEARLLTRRGVSGDTERTEQADHSLLASLRALQQLTALVAREKGPLPVLELLRTIYGPRNLNSIPGATETAETIAEWIHGVGSLADQLPSTEILSLLQLHLRSQICTGEKLPSSIELQGWLELLWEDSPHLIVTGMNDGLVPEVRPADPFLTEKIRERWQLPSNKTRLHRDCYQAVCLVAARALMGRVDFLLSRRDSEGSFLKPSRLLLQCRDEELAGRVEDLFRELPQRTSKPWRSAWQLEAQAAGIRKPDHLSASSIKEYLACPTRYYFKKLAGLSKENFGVEELEGNVFGSLLHEALQEFGSDTVSRDLTDEPAIAHDLEHRWSRIFHARYGEDPDLALLYQLKAGTKRLREAARVQAALRAEGWEIVGCEFEFSGFRPKALDHSRMPLPIVGRIDRIDRRRNEDGSYSWRIIDYKSSEDTETPQASHLKKVTKLLDRSAHQEYEFVGLKKNSKSKKKGEEEVQTSLHRWVDLQLPIYALVAKAVKEGDLSISRLPKVDGEVESAYFQIPADENDTGIAIFAEFEGWEASALKCLSGVSRSIQEGIFWPPRDPKYDDFEGIFFDHLIEESAALRTINPKPLLPSPLSPSSPLSDREQGVTA